MMEKNGQKNLLQNFDLISDKLYFAGKLEIGDRTPVFEYSNQVFDNPYTKEKCFLFYVRLDKDVIQRIEIPGFALNHIETIHAMLLNEYKLSIKKLRKKGIYALNKANGNLVCKKIKRKEIIELIDLMVKDEMTRNYRRKIGLMANFV